MKKLAVITAAPSDFSAMLETVPGISVSLIQPGDVLQHDLDGFEAICILGGTGQPPLVFAPPQRRALEAQLAKGKRMFAEYTRSIGLMYAAPPKSTRYSRLVCAAPLPGLAVGDVLDEQANHMCSPHFCSLGATPLLVYQPNLQVHGKTMPDGTERENTGQWALWQETENLMVCSFRLCGFSAARFAPRARWRAVVEYITSWLLAGGRPAALPAPAWQCAAHVPGFVPGTEALARCVQRGLGWFGGAGMVLAGGAQGVLEGLHTEIAPDGAQAAAGDIRADCCAEVGFAYFAEYLRTKNEEYLAISARLEDYCFENFFVAEGRFKGMLRWTNVAWGVCYPDDAARVLLPSLFKAWYTQDGRWLDKVEEALAFLLSITGPDGLLEARFDAVAATEEDMARRKTQAGGFASAHYTAFYHAALLLCGMLTQNEELLGWGEKGLASIMARYPHTVREHSETQEMCRLILPLSLLVQARGGATHRQWLYTVAKDLEAHRHPCGAHLEWDTGYTAAFSRKLGEECSLLCENGDPVADLLYSVNWLPMGYTQAYLATGDSWFMELWEKTAAFLRAAQLRSPNPRLHGAWARGVDADRMEVFGNPNDTGWGPCAIESGWTVGEIVAGLSLGLQADKLKRFYTKPTGGTT